MTKKTYIITIDDRGRIVIPKQARNDLGITTNSQLMMVSDSEVKELKISRIPGRFDATTGMPHDSASIGLKDESNLIKLKITMKDAPGALAKLATLFGDLKLSMMYSEAVIVEKDKTAVWTVISESPQSPLEELEKILKG